MSPSTFLTVASTIVAIAAVYGSPKLFIGGLLLNLYFLASGASTTTNISVATVVDGGIKATQLVLELPKFIALHLVSVGANLLSVLFALVNGACRNPVSTASSIAVAAHFCLRVLWFDALFVCTFSSSVIAIVLRLVFLSSMGAMLIVLGLALYVIKTVNSAYAKFVNGAARFASATIIAWSSFTFNTTAFFDFVCINVFTHAAIVRHGPMYPSRLLSLEVKPSLRISFIPRAGLIGYAPPHPLRIASSSFVPASPSASSSLAHSSPSATSSSSRGEGDAVSNVTELGDDGLTLAPGSDNDPAELEARLLIASITAVNALMLAAIAQKNAERKDMAMAAVCKAFCGETLEPEFYISHGAVLAAAKGAKVAAHKRMMEAGRLLVPESAEDTGSVDSAADDDPGRLDDRLPPEIADIVRDWLQMCHEEIQDALLAGDAG